MLEALQNIKLRKNEDIKIKDSFGVKATKINAKPVLVISRNWKSVYEWVSEDTKLIIITDKNIKRKFDFTDQKSYEHVEVFENLDSGIVDLRAEELHKKYNFTAVVCLGEEDILRCARWRKRFGIENSGQTIESAMRYRDKVIMKEVLKSQNIDVPIFSPVEDVSSIIEFISTHGYSTVVKPRKGYGSVSTSIITSQNDLESFLTTFSPVLDSSLGLEIERYIDGPMYHVDGFVYNGNITISWPSCYLTYCGDFKKEKFNASYTLHSSNPLVERIQQYIEKVVKGLGGPNFFPFHAEVWHTPDDRIVLCEIASRVGGAGIRHVIEAQFGVLLDKLWVQAQCNDKIKYNDLEKTYHSKKPQFGSAGWIIIYPEIGKLVTRPEREESDIIPFIIKYFPIANKGDVYKTASHSADAVAQFIVNGNSEEEVIINLMEAYKWFISKAKWEKNE